MDLTLNQSKDAEGPDGQPGTVNLSELEERADHIITAASKDGIVMKLSGSLAIRKHCAGHRDLQTRSNRIISDIDLIAYFRSKPEIEVLMEQLGYVNDPAIATLPGIRRSLFCSPDRKYRCDIFYDALEFCHKIDLRDRLEVDHPTIPLLELLLQKLQIVELTYKDIMDVQLLLLEHGAGTGDKETINIDLFSRMCGNNWGLWYTAKENLLKIQRYTAEDAALIAEEKKLIEDRIVELLRRLDNSRKSLWWKLRALLGTKVRWYNVVEDIEYSFA